MRFDDLGRFPSGAGVAGCLLLILGGATFSGCGDRATNSVGQAWIEDGIPAADKPADAVTAHARTFFADWLKNHGESNVVNDASGVGISSSPTRLWAFQYGLNETANGFSAETEFRIVLPDGQEIVEFVAGSGETADQAIEMTLLNFMMSTCHVVYSCFMNPNDPHLTHERVQIGGSDRLLTTGGMIAIGDDDLPEFTEVSEQVEREILKLDLENKVYWLKVVYGRHQDEVIAAAVTLNNEEFAPLSSRLDALDWPKTETFYLAKQFVVIRPAQDVPVPTP